MAKDAPAFTPSQSALCKSLQNKSNPEYYYQGKHPQAGQPKPKALKLLTALANHKLGTGPGRPADAEDRDTREKRPERELLGQYWIERTPQRFEGREPQLSPMEWRRLLNSLTPEQRARIAEETRPSCTVA